ncbi:MAG: ADP-forming succinate--CoA ligase subunit beta [Thermoanaerobaculia bacterium]|nr:ADP-forming succinate--CoA ligase subunit beta [Thermoanaerobaculia bacterium]MCZ7651225.1 ADP-forming succinate--CoA ligase subunit beta [Thermoanaerobaculia bacterium]
MKIHEYQAKEILRRYGVATPRGRVTADAGEARAIAEELGGRVVVKAQIHAGGRGKGGGVKLAKDPAEAEALAGQILGMQLVTHQTGPEGQKVQKVLIEEALEIARELYLAVTLDRAAAKPVIIASAAGGMEIEVVAERDPDAITRVHVDPHLGLLPFQGRLVAKRLGLEGDTANKAGKLVAALVKAYLETDASLAEINPLMITAQGDVLALDAKMNFDDNALFRHRDVVAMRDVAEENPLEVEASKFDLNYIKLDGEIGCMVNGAGLAMATMDIIKLYGSEPANFLDVGGSASQEAVANAFRILVSDASVKAVLINIFGGIARTDRIANGVVEALRSLGGVAMPVVVRLEGTNVEQGRAILRESEFHFIVAETMADAAQKVVAAVRGGA